MTTDNENRLSVDTFSTATALASVFTPDGDVTGARLLRTLPDRWFEFFSAEPMVLPTVAGLPSEVARLILSTPDGAWRCEFAPARTNLHWRLSGNNHGDPPALDQFYGIAADFLSEYASLTTMRVARIAAVANRFAPVENPGLRLARHFCQERWWDAPLNRPENFELHAHKTYEFPTGEHVNSWVRSRTGRVTHADGNAHPAVLVEQDLNTIATDVATRSYEVEHLAAFYGQCGQEMNQILRLYYP